MRNLANGHLQYLQYFLELLLLTAYGIISHCHFTKFNLKKMGLL
jgi:hypothetical protein